MFRTVSLVSDGFNRKQGAIMLRLSCGHMKLCRWRGQMKKFCSWCASGMRPVAEWIPQTKHVHPRHRRHV